MTEPDDKFARYLDGKSRVSRVYQELDAPAPPEGVSAKVLEQARAAVERPAGDVARRPGWMVPLSLAATLVVAVSIAFQTLPSRQSEISAVDLEPGARGAPIEAMRQQNAAATQQQRSPAPRPEILIDREPLPVAPGRINEREAREAIADASEQIRRDIVQISPPTLPEPAESKRDTKLAKANEFAPPPAAMAESDRLQKFESLPPDERESVVATGSRIRRADIDDAVSVESEPRPEPRGESTVAASAESLDAAAQDKSAIEETIIAAAPHPDADSDALGMSAGDTAAAAEDRSARTAPAAAAPVADVSGFASTAPMLDEKSERAARTWLSDIRKLHDDGEVAEAQASLVRFRERFPDYPLPDDFPLPDPAEADEQG